MHASAPVPAPHEDDDEDVSWALSTAQALWHRGEHAEALKWLRRAAEQASDANEDDRALELFKAAADVASRLKPQGPPGPQSAAPAASSSAPPRHARTLESAALALVPAARLPESGRPPVPPARPPEGPRPASGPPEGPRPASGAPPNVTTGPPVISLGTPRSAPPPRPQSEAAPRNGEGNAGSGPPGRPPVRTQSAPAPPATRGALAPRTGAPPPPHARPVPIAPASIPIDLQNPRSRRPPSTTPTGGPAGAPGPEACPATELHAQAPLIFEQSVLDPPPPAAEHRRPAPPDREPSRLASMMLEAVASTERPTQASTPAPATQESAENARADLFGATPSRGRKPTSPGRAYPEDEVTVQRDIPSLLSRPRGDDLDEETGVLPSPAPSPARGGEPPETSGSAPGAHAAQAAEETTSLMAAPAPMAEEPATLAEPTTDPSFLWNGGGEDPASSVKGRGSEADRADAAHAIEAYRTPDLRLTSLAAAMPEARPVPEVAGALELPPHRVEEVVESATAPSVGFLDAVAISPQESHPEDDGAPITERPGSLSGSAMSWHMPSPPAPAPSPAAQALFPLPALRVAVVSNGVPGEARIVAMAPGERAPAGASTALLVPLSADDARLFVELFGPGARMAEPYEETDEKGAS